MKSKRVPVVIDAALDERLQAYSKATEVPVARVVSRGLNDWLDTVGRERLDALTLAGGGRRRFFLVLASLLSGHQEPCVGIESYAPAGGLMDGGLLRRGNRFQLSELTVAPGGCMLCRALASPSTLAKYPHRYAD